MNKIVTEKKEACNKLLDDINKNTAIIDKKNKEAIEKEKKLSADSKVVEAKKNEADKMLEEAMPALNAAIKKLDEISNTDIAFIKQMQNPKVEIKTTCFLCHLILDPTAGPSWDETKSKMLTNASLLKELKSLKGERKDKLTESQIRKINTNLHTYMKSYPSYEDYRARVAGVSPPVGSCLLFSLSLSLSLLLFLFLSLSLLLSLFLSPSLCLSLSLSLFLSLSLSLARALSLFITNMQHIETLYYIDKKHIDGINEIIRDTRKSKHNIDIDAINPIK